MIPRPQFDDILGSILCAKDEPQDEEKRQVANIIYAFFPRHGMKNKLGSTALPAAQPRKTTHYLTDEIYGKLRDTQERLCDQEVPVKKQRISRSRIINKALAILFEDYARLGAESALAKAFTDK